MRGSHSKSSSKRTYSKCTWTRLQKSINVFTNALLSVDSNLIAKKCLWFD